MLNFIYIYLLNCSDEHGDQPRQLPTLPELQKALDIFERTESPSWDYDVSGACLCSL